MATPMAIPIATQLPLRFIVIPLTFQELGKTLFPGIDCVDPIRKNS
jgi:hypothetical protein